MNSEALSSLHVTKKRPKAAGKMGCLVETLAAVESRCVALRQGLFYFYFNVPAHSQNNKREGLLQQTGQKRILNLFLCSFSLDVLFHVPTDQL